MTTFLPGSRAPSDSNKVPPPGASRQRIPPQSGASDRTAAPQGEASAVDPGPHWPRTSGSSKAGSTCRSSASSARRSDSEGSSTRSASSGHVCAWTQIRTPEAPRTRVRVHDEPVIATSEPLPDGHCPSSTAPDWLFDIAGAGHHTVTGRATDFTAASRDLGAQIAPFRDMRFRSRTSPTPARFGHRRTRWAVEASWT